MGDSQQRAKSLSVSNIPVVLKAKLGGKTKGRERKMGNPGKGEDSP